MTEAKVYHRWDCALCGIGGDDDMYWDGASAHARETGHSVQVSFPALVDALGDRKLWTV